MLLHGVAFLSWNQHPEPKAQGDNAAPPFSTFLGTTPSGSVDVGNEPLKVEIEH
jgi:hypothetical protein